MQFVYVISAANINTCFEAKCIKVEFLSATETSAEGKTENTMSRENARYAVF